VNGPRTLMDKTLRKADERLGFASVARTALGKIFPDHWSFMLGEIALYSFVILVFTGIYLALFFEPSSALRVYHGSYAPVHGKEVSAAFASTVEISWDVRGGLLIRQAHHWAAHIFIGAIVLHLCRIYFTGMFRKPREINWVVGLTLLLLAIFNAFAGYSLPDDLLSGTGLHIFYSTLEAVPFVGGWLTMLVFGGEFPGHFIIERLYPVHIFLVPAAIAGLLVVHLGVLIRQKHSHFPGPGRNDANVVGSRVWPGYALRSLALLCAVTAVTLLAGGLAQINPVWVWGDFDSSTITAPSVADWYIAWIEGALRLFPPVEIRLGTVTVPNQFWPAILLPGVTFLVLYAWPLIDRRLTGDRGTHHLTGRPRESPVRLAIGVWAVCFYALLLLASGEELLVQWTQLPIGTVRAVLRLLVVVLPLVAAAVAHRVARALNRSEAQGALYLSSADLLHANREPDGADQADGADRADQADGTDQVDEADGADEVDRVDGRGLSESPAWLADTTRRDR